MAYQWATGNSRHCSQCWCYSCAQEHLYRHLSRAVGFACNARSSTKVLRALCVPCCPPKRAKNLKCLWPSLGSTPHTACVTGSLQSSEMPALRIKQQRRWEHSCCRTRSHPGPSGPFKTDPPTVTGQWQPSGWQGQRVSALHTQYRVALPNQSPKWATKNRVARGTKVSGLSLRCCFTNRWSHTIREADRDYYTVMETSLVPSGELSIQWAALFCSFQHLLRWDLLTCSMPGSSQRQRWHR